MPLRKQIRGNSCSGAIWLWFAANPAGIERGQNCCEVVQSGELLLCTSQEDGSGESLGSGHGIGVDPLLILGHNNRIEKYRSDPPKFIVPAVECVPDTKGSRHRGLCPIRFHVEDRRYTVRGFGSCRLSMTRDCSEL